MSVSILESFHSVDLAIYLYHLTVTNFGNLESESSNIF